MKTLISKINKYIIITTLILSIVEMLCFSTIDFIGALMFLLSWYILSLTVFRYKNVVEHTIPFFIIFSYAICFFFLPLVCTLLELKPLTYNFKVPRETFIHQFIFLMILILAFEIMVKLGKNNIRYFLYRKTNIFTPLSSQGLWILGFIGLFSHTFFLFVSETGILGKITDGLKFFAIAPVLLLFPDLFTRNTEIKIDKPTIQKLICYAIFFIILAMATNSRTGMLFLLVSTVLVFLLYLLTYNIPLKQIIKTKFIILALILFYVISGPLSDLGVAMVGVRNTRSDVDPITLMKKTWAFYNGPNFKTFKKQLYSIDPSGNILDTEWSEEYIDHVFLNRLCNLKVSDATLYYADELGYNNEKMKESFYDQLLANLPSGIIEASFKETMRYSAGDKLYTLATGQSGLGGYRVAGYTGLGLATFGYKFYLISFIFYLFCFYMLDCFSIIVNRRFIISILALLHVDSWFYFLNNGAGILRNISYICRGYFQDILLFIIVLSIIKYFDKSQLKRI